MYKQIMVVVSRADSTLGQRITHILSNHGIDVILLFQNMEVTLKLAKRIYDQGNDCIMIDQNTVTRDGVRRLIETLRREVTTEVRMKDAAPVEHTVVYIS